MLHVAQAEATTKTGIQAYYLIVLCLVGSSLSNALLLKCLITLALVADVGMYGRIARDRPPCTVITGGSYSMLHAVPSALIKAQGHCCTC
jgi:hypothetical protein